MKIAIVGAGVSGLVAARLLHLRHALTVFEAGGHAGGHARTLEVEEDGRRLAVDTGFIVYNERNYPQFTRLLARLGVESRPTDMSFGLRDDRDGLEYRGSGLGTLFAQRRNLLRPSFHRMLADVLRFQRRATAVLEAPAPGLTLGELLRQGGYCRAFVEQHLLPMGGAIWSTSPHDMERFPAQTFVRFFHNHGLLSLRDRPRWRVIRGGSRRYVEALVAPFGESIRLHTPVAGIRRDKDGVELVTATGEHLRFDAVVLACHSDQALRLLADASDAEREILGALPYRANPTQLHTDVAVLPRNPRARASWNVRIREGESVGVGVSYHMNRLQGLTARRDYIVSLNQREQVDPRLLLDEHVFEHPVFSQGAIDAQQRRAEIQGHRNTWFCGAYWRHGFHEDGVVSGLEVVRQLGGETL